MSLARILFFGLFLLFGCGQASDTEEVLIRRVFDAENRMVHSYFTTNVGEAEVSLRRYLEETAKIKPSSDMARAQLMLFSGRGLALARLEFLLASKNGNTADLNRAVKEFRQATPANGELSDYKIALAIVEIVKGETGEVSWLTNLDKLATDALARIEASHNP